MTSHKIQFVLAFIGGFSLISVALQLVPQLLNWDIWMLSEDDSDSNVLAQTYSQPSPDLIGDLNTLGILLLGYGGAGHDGGYLTDAIQLLHVDVRTAKIALISIPRDLWVNNPGGVGMKINNVLVANADGTNHDTQVKSGAPALKKVVSEITGLKIDYFIGTDFVGYQRAIGLIIDGIEVEVAEPLDDPWYPVKGRELDLCDMTPAEVTDVHSKYTGFELERQFTCRYKHLRFERGLHHMEGEQALEYVRSRHGSSEGDLSRGKRQQDVITAIKNKIVTLGALDDLPSFFAEISKHISTDVDLEIAKYLLPLVETAREFRTVTINLSTANVLTTSKSSNGAFIMVPKEGTNKWTKIQEYIKEYLNKKPKVSP